MLQALLFDCDGTLADTERDGHRVAFNRAFKEAGLDWSWTEAIYAELLEVTGGKERIRFYINRLNSKDAGSKLSEQQIRDLHKAKSREFKKIVDSGELPLRTGVARLIGEAKRSGLRLAVVTTTTKENVKALLNGQFEGAVEEYFELIAAGDVVQSKKPAPDIYTWALQQMDLEPQHCLAIEDSRNGLLAANRAGIQAAVITTNEYTLGENFSEAALVVDHLGNPEHPCRVQRGTMDACSQVDIPVLRSIHRDCNPKSQN